MLDLVINVKNCAMVKDHLGYRSDMDAMHRLDGVVRYLPSKLQIRWAKHPEIMGWCGHKDNFEDLNDYPEEQAKLACCGFGCPARKSRRIRKRFFS